MNDQAEGLRKRLNSIKNKRVTKTLAVVSGKGGVGKSNFSLNFAISLTKQGANVLIFDMDIGMGNLDILMGQSSEKTIVDFFEKNVPLKDLILLGPEDLHFIAGGTGLTHIARMNHEMSVKFTEELANILENYDYVIFDMGAGVSEDSLNIILSVDEVIVITTPEPTSITDAYATMKFVHLLNQTIPFFIVVNRVYSDKEGKSTIQRLQTVVKQFLGRETTALGTIPDDRSILQAVRRQIPYTLYNDRSPASKAINEMTKRYMNNEVKDIPKSNTFHFVSKLKRFLFER